MATPRFNLRNASLFLNRLRNKYSHSKNQDENVYDNTFIDEEDQLTSGPSVKRLMPKKNDPNSSRFEDQNKATTIFVQQNQTAKQKNDKEDLQGAGLNKEQSAQTQFCDLIIIKYLEETLAIYKNDLEILEHNRENLEQEIYFIGKKIAKLHQIFTQNKDLQTQIQDLNKELQDVIRSYHQSNKILYKKKMTSGKLFHKYQNKIKKFLLSNSQQFDSLEHFIRVDEFKKSYAEQYSSYFEYKNDQEKVINYHIQKNQKDPEYSQKVKENMLKNLFQNKQGIYLTEKSPLRHLKEQKIKQAKIQEKKTKNVVLYDQEEQYDKEISEDPNNKDKTKKLTQAEKALLLGDLKNFAKSFKLPK